MEETIRTLGILRARHFSARLDSVRLRTGKVTERIKIDHPEAAAILAFPEPGKILMVRQWRYALGAETFEIPAGKMDPGEPADVCAGRELFEETGHRAARMKEIFSYYPAIGYANEVIRIFVASGLERVSDREDEDEIARVEAVEFDHVYDMVMNGTIRDGKTVIGLTIFRAKMNSGDIPEEFLR